MRGSERNVRIIGPAKAPTSFLRFQNLYAVQQLCQKSAFFSSRLEHVCGKSQL
jgi:hypothetical protein